MVKYDKLKRRNLAKNELKTFKYALIKPAGKDHRAINGEWARLCNVVYTSFLVNDPRESIEKTTSFCMDLRQKIINHERLLNYKERLYPIGQIVQNIKGIWEKNN